MSKSLEELKYELAQQQATFEDDFIKGFDAAIKAVSERDKKLMEENCRWC